MQMKIGILYFTTCFHGFAILRHVDPFVRMLHIYNCSGPNLAKDDPFIPPTENDEVFTQCITKYHIIMVTC